MDSKISPGRIPADAALLLGSTETIFTTLSLLSNPCGLHYNPIYIITQKNGFDKPFCRFKLFWYKIMKNLEKSIVKKSKV
jgi:hypothetical protein